LKLKGIPDRVLFVGVIHTDVDSVKKVRKTVRETKPDVVAVELDRDRYQQLLHPPTEQEMAAQAPTGEVVQDLFQQIALLEKRLGGLTGSDVGAEMLAAIEEGRKLGAKIALVDRPIQATIQAIMSVPLDEVYRMFNMIPGASDDIKDGGAEDLMTTLKEEGAVTAVMEQFRTEFPHLSDALIDERDEYVANALCTILNDVKGKIVAVLGAGHIDGVQKALSKQLESQAGS
jgi:pheromone shutdown protein TraB